MFYAQGFIYIITSLIITIYAPVLFVQHIYRLNLSINNKHALTATGSSQV